MSFGYGTFQFGVDVTLPVLQNLVLWLDASDINTISLDTLNVTQWDDKSGNGNNFEQLTASDQPTYLATGQNGLGTIEFTDGQDQFMDAASVLISGTDARTIIFTCWGESGLATSLAMFTLNQSGANGARYQVLIGTANTTTNLQVVSGNSNFDEVALDTMGINVLRTAATGTVEDSTLRVDGQTTSRSGNPEPIDTASTGFTQIGINAAQSQYWKGEMAEIIFYDRELSDTEVETMENYLAAKWGVTLV